MAGSQKGSVIQRGGVEAPWGKAEAVSSKCGSVVTDDVRFPRPSKTRVGTARPQLSKLVQGWQRNQRGDPSDRGGRPWMYVEAFDIF